MTAAVIAKALGGRKAGAGWMARCPAHHDQMPSLSIREAADGKVLIRCHAGCDQEQVIASLRSRCLWTEIGSRRFMRLASSGVPKKTGPDRHDTKPTEAALAIWQATISADGTLVKTYLVSRGLNLPPTPMLRFLAELKHPSGAETRLEKLPRMADFALWATACETALWPAGTFWSAYCGNGDEAVEGVIDADPIATAVRAVIATRTVWTGTASDLLGALAEVMGERVAKSKSWPDGPRAARTRTINITTIQPAAAPEKPGAEPSAPSAPMPKSSSTNGFTAPNRQTAAKDADGTGGGTNPLKSNGSTDADGADAGLPLQSALEGNNGAVGWSAGL